MTALRTTADTKPADWIVAGLKGPDVSVHSIVPAGFASYLRVFHPAHLRASSDTSRPVRWADVAAANHKSVHVGMQFDVLIDSRDLYNLAAQPGVFDDPPEVGSLPRSQIDALLPVLFGHTTTAPTCLFACWEGWGDLRADIASAPKFEAPWWGRSYHLLLGPIESAVESVNEHVEQSPSLWWPEDHAWCVATEIDFNSTYIGCDKPCCDAILRLAAIEALLVDPANRGYGTW